MVESISLKPIGIVHSCYVEKFGAPRQAGLAPHALAQIVMLPPYDDPAMFSGLEQFSHIWLITQFHQHQQKNLNPTVRPPRLGGNEKIGVFASRSSFRPNHLSLSVVKLLSVNTEKGVSIEVAGLDMIEGTPVLDIKPYIPYADAIDNAEGAYAQQAPTNKPVQLTAQAEQDLANLQQQALKQLIIETLAQDPKPAYHDDPQRVYGLSLWHFNIRWRSLPTVVEVIAVEQRTE